MWLLVQHRCVVLKGHGLMKLGREGLAAANRRFASGVHKEQHLQRVEAPGLDSLPRRWNMENTAG